MIGGLFAVGVFGWEVEEKPIPGRIVAFDLTTAKGQVFIPTKAIHETTAFVFRNTLEKGIFDTDSIVRAHQREFSGDITQYRQGYGVVEREPTEKELSYLLAQAKVGQVKISNHFDPNIKLVDLIKQQARELGLRLKES